MGGFFGVASKESCIFDLFFGIDYHSHLGTRRGGMVLYSEEKGFDRAIHNIENSPFRTKFDKDFATMDGHLGIGCISDHEPQPLLIRSHLGNYAISTVGKVNNLNSLAEKLFDCGKSHFLEMSGGEINQTELVAALINQKDSIVEGMLYAQEVIDGSMSVLLMTKEGIYAMRDRYGRTPVIIGKKPGAYCVSFENFAYMHLGYADYKELGPGEIVYITPEEVKVMASAGDEMKICTFLWVYYGYPTSAYEGVNVEEMRNRCGRYMAQRDNVDVDLVAGVPDSGLAHAIGYANEAHKPFARPFIKYTPTWPRSFMPTKQEQRKLIAKMKLIPVEPLIRDKKLLLIDDSIVRGTQLRETTDFLFNSGAKEVHIRPACPPIIHGCKYLNFSRSNSDMDLIARRVIAEREKEVTPEVLADYSNPESKNYKEMEQCICKQMNFTSLSYNRLDDMIKAVGIEPCKLCTYCWNGKE
ncbi:MAG: amidophosphoribosyltransferase [Lachnospiraceae bacterium]|nr:amidophosphoribosyltransferase [Lachnospiraceae bacterium]MBQ7833291.1 amidophosphoribosyltransferase [Lachnospiraceae bacterium]